MAFGLWAEAREPAQQREPGARRSRSNGRSWGSYEPPLVGLEASKLNSRLNCMLNSRSGLSGSCEELARSLCARCSGAIGFAQAPARRAVISAAPSRRSRTSTCRYRIQKNSLTQSVSQSV